MSEEKQLKRLQAGSEDALCYFIRRYTAYVSAIVWRTLGQSMTAQDAEEVISDVFLTLWRRCDRVQPDKLRPWLAAVAHNAALSKLRRIQNTIPLEEDQIELAGSGPEAMVEDAERSRLVTQAVDSLGEPDRTIFLRHYYYRQSTSIIADGLDMKPDAVRQRLKRGRDRLRTMLSKGGMNDEIFDL